MIQSTQVTCCLAVDLTTVWYIESIWGYKRNKDQLPDIRSSQIEADRWRSEQRDQIKRESEALRSDQKNVPSKRPNRIADPRFRNDRSISAFPPMSLSRSQPSPCFVAVSPRVERDPSVLYTGVGIQELGPFGSVSTGTCHPRNVDQ